MGVSLWMAGAVCFLGIVAWLLSKAREQGESFSLVPAYVSQHGTTVFLALIVTSGMFIWDVVYGPRPIAPSRLIAIFFMAGGAISFFDHGRGGGKK